jgi:hypothetical protein
MIGSSTTALKPQGGSTSSKSRKPAPRERTIVYEGSSGPRELMESIVIQAQAAIKGLGPSPAELKKAKEPTEEEKRRIAGAPVPQDVKGKTKATFSEDNTRLRIFWCVSSFRFPPSLGNTNHRPCHSERIVVTAQAVDRSLRETKGDEFLKRLHDGLPKISTSSSAFIHHANSADITTAYDHIPVGTTDSETEANYVKWAQQIRFEYCDLTLPPAESPKDIAKPNDDGPPHYRHAYDSDIRMLANADIPKRSLAIAKEVRPSLLVLSVGTFESNEPFGTARHSDNKFARRMGLYCLPAGRRGSG